MPDRASIISLPDQALSLSRQPPGTTIRQDNISQNFGELTAHEKAESPVDLRLSARGAVRIRTGDSGFTIRRPTPQTPRETHILGTV